MALTTHLEDFVAEQVQSGRFANPDEVVAAALRPMEESECEREQQAFEATFQAIDRHSPEGEPAPGDLAEIERIVKSVRLARQQPPAA